jgi:hypothetical protein
MLMIMVVLVCVRHFGLLFCSLIRLCHLSLGQFHAFHEASDLPRRRMLDERGLRLFTTVRGFDRQGQTSRRPDPRRHLHSSPSRPGSNAVLQRVPRT